MISKAKIKFLSAYQIQILWYKFTDNLKKTPKLNLWENQSKLLHSTTFGYCFLAVP